MPYVAPTDHAEQMAILREIVRKNGVDAWDMGFQGQLNPGAIDQAIQIYLDGRGFEGTRKLLMGLKKR